MGQPDGKETAEASKAKSLAIKPASESEIARARVKQEQRVATTLGQKVVKR